MRTSVAYRFAGADGRSFHSAGQECLLAAEEGLSRAQLTALREQDARRALAGHFRLGDIVRVRRNCSGDGASARCRSVGVRARSICCAADPRRRLRRTSALTRITDQSQVSRHVRKVPILLQKSAVTDDVVRPFHLGAAGFGPRPRRSLRNFYTTQYTEPERVAVAQPAMRAAVGSERWRPEQIHPGRLGGHAVEAGRASGCA